MCGSTSKAASEDIANWKEFEKKPKYKAKHSKHIAKHIKSLAKRSKHSAKHNKNNANHSKTYRKHSIWVKGFRNQTTPATTKH